MSDLHIASKPFPDMVFDEYSDYNFGGMRFARAQLRQWMDERRREHLMKGMELICKERGLDPDTATIRQFLDLK